MKILKNFLAIVLSVIVLSVSVLAENAASSRQVQEMKHGAILYGGKNPVTVTSGSQKVSISTSYNLKDADVIETGENQSAEIRMDERGIIRMSQKTKLTLRKSDLAGNYLFVLDGGQVWLNTLYYSASVNIQAGAALLIPERGIADIVYDRTKVDIRVITNQVGVGLVDPAKAYEKFYSAHDSALINYYLVAQGNQTTVFNEKITSEQETVAKLLYSKLIKEFQVGFIDTTNLAADGWYLKNIQLDRDLKESMAKEIAAEINSRGLQLQDLNSVGYQFRKFTDEMARYLTFSEEKNRQREIGSLFGQLEDSEYLLLFSRNAEAKERLDIFSQSIETFMAAGNEDVANEILAKLNTIYYQLSYVYPDDKLYTVKQKVRDLLLNYLGDRDLFKKFYLVRDDINYAYNLANTSQLNAKISLEQYFRNLGILLGKNKSRVVNYPYLVLEENQLMDNLLRRFSLFYQDSFFGLKKAWESEFLALLPDGGAKDEEKQSIISNKIDFLKQLQNFFLANQVSLRETRVIVLRLINEIKDMLPNKEVGVSQLFAVRLKDYGTFLRFLNSSMIVNLRGAAIKTGYTDFIAQQREEVSLEEVIKEFMPGEQTKSQLTVADIEKQIRDDFTAAGVIDLKLGTIASADQKLVSVEKAFLENKAFSGTYNFDLGLISKVTVDGKIIAKDAMKLSGLKALLNPPEETMQITQESTIETQAVSQEVPRKVSRSEKVAKVLMVQKLKGYGIIALENNIEIADKAKSLYSIRDAVLEANANIKFSFDFVNNTDTALNIVLSTEAGEKLVSESIKGDDFSSRILDIYAPDEGGSQQTM